MSDLDAAIQRLEAWLSGDGNVMAADLRTVIAAAKRPPLTEVSSDKLAAFIQARARIEETATGWNVDQFALADAILAGFRPVVSTRERLFAVIDTHSPDAGYNMDDSPNLCACGATCGSDHVAAALLGDPEGEFGIDPSQRAVEDRAEVEAKAVEAAADDRTSPASEKAYITPEGRAWLRTLASSIREGRSLLPAPATVKHIHEDASWWRGCPACL